jgi:WD40 repeat protein
MRLRIARTRGPARQHPESARQVVDGGFDAFISYSTPDRPIASQLHKRIETSAKKWYRRPSVRVFFDKASIATGTELPTRIEFGLASSSWLVLIASPLSAQSEWVRREVEWWLTHKSASSIFIVKTDGTLNWDDAVGCFSADSTAIASFLRDKFDREPVWATVPQEDPGTSLEDAAVSIASKIRGIDYHEQASQAFREHRRTMLWARRAIASLSVLLVAALVLSVIAWKLREDALNNLKRATGTQLIAEAGAMLANTRFGTDDLAFQKLLAGRFLNPGFEADGALYSTVATEVATRKIINVNQPVYSVAVSPKAAVMVSGSGDGFIRIWDLRKHKMSRPPLQAHSGPVRALAFSPDGRLLVSGGDDHSIRLWDAHSWQPRGQNVTEHRNAVYDVAFSPDNSRIASASFDHTIGIWDVVDDQLRFNIPLKGHASDVYSVAFSPDRQQLASASDDQTVRFWDARSLKPIGPPLEGHRSRVRKVVFNHDGSRLVSGGRDGSVIVWDAYKHAIQHGPSPGHTGSVYDVAFNPDGTQLVSSSRDNTLQARDPVTGEPIGDPVIGHDGVVNGIAFDGPTLISCSNDGTIRFWDLNADRPWKETGPVKSVAVSPDRRHLAIASGKIVHVRDLSTGDIHTFAGHSAFVRSVDFSPDGRVLVSGGEDKTIQMWDTTTWASAGEPIVLPGQVYAVAFSPDGHRFASGSDDQDVRIWSTENDKPVGSPKILESEGRVYSVAFSPDGGTLAWGGDDKVVRLWDALSGNRRSMPAGHNDAIWAVRFSPDGHTVASGSADNTIRLWDIKTMIQSGKQRNERNVVWSLDFNHDGSRLVSASGANTLQLWDLKTQDPIGNPLTGHHGAVNSVRFSLDGREIFSGSDDQTLRRWITSASEPELCAKLTANLSPKQWKDWVSSLDDIGYRELCPDLHVSAP